VEGFDAQKDQDVTDEKHARAQPKMQRGPPCEHAVRVLTCRGVEWSCGHHTVLQVVG
jgi:hypothetical protein